MGVPCSELKTTMNPSRALRASGHRAPVLASARSPSLAPSLSWSIPVIMGGTRGQSRSRSHWTLGGLITEI